MKRYNQIMRSIPPVVLAVTLTVIYALTMAPDITWANSGSDGGDLISAAATNGIAHPTGYPVYLIVARLVQFVPIGTLAYRTNLLSALSMTLASVLIYFIIVRESKNASAWIAGWIGAFFFGVAPIVWSQSVITEVYGLNAFFIALLLYLLATSNFLLVGLIFGLSLGNHLTSILLAPIVFLLPALDRKQQSKPNASVFSLGVKVFAGMLLGLLSYLTLPFRAFAHPPINWGNPIAWDGFLWLISGLLYQGKWIDTLPLLIVRIRALAVLSLQQVGVPGLAFGLGGAILSARSKPLRRSTTWIFAAYSIFTLFYGTVDAHLNLIPALLCFAIWIGMGADDLIAYADQRIKFGGFAPALLAAVYLIYSAVLTFPVVNASRDDRAVKFGETAMRGVPPRALIFAKGDAPIFTLWYYHYALGERPDIVVVADDLLHFQWYLDTLRYTYPDLVLDESFPFQSTVSADNPDRPVCVVRSLQSSSLDCAP